MTVGLIYILRGTFKVRLRQKLRSEDSELKEIIMEEGDYLDYERIESEF
jgi:hypothetical protein